jgi:galactokinase
MVFIIQAVQALPIVCNDKDASISGGGGFGGGAVLLAPTGRVWK